MLRYTFTTTLVLLTASATLAPAGEKEDLVAAAQKLADAGNYSWTTTTEGGGGGGGGGAAMGAGGASGKTQPDGLTMLVLDLRDNQARVIMKGDKAAVETPDEGWQAVSAADAGGRDRRDGPRDPNRDPNAAGGAGGGPGAGGAPGDGPNPVRMVANMVRTYQPPAAQALHLATKAQDVVKQPDGSYTGTLSEDGARALMQRRVGRRMADGQGGAGAGAGGAGAAGGAPGADRAPRGGGGGGGGPDVKEPKATVTFWTDNAGQLTKFQFNVQGKMTTRDGEEREINRTTTVEFSDVGTTTIEVPEEAKAKLG